MLKKRIAIVGAGASGMSAAHALASSHENFEVCVFESSATLGGMATSAPVVPVPHTPAISGDGIHDSTPLFHNTYKLFSELGLSKSERSMQLRFEHAAEQKYWKDVFPKETIEIFRADIERFGRALQVVKMLEPLFAILSIRTVLRVFNFSPDFGHRLVFPLISTFFGTGHQTPYLSSVVVGRLFTDPDMKFFHYSRDTFLKFDLLSLRAFPHLDHFYQAWSERLASTGVINLRTSREVTRVVRKNKDVGGIQLWHRAAITAVDVESDSVAQPANSRERVEFFDELIMATDAEAALGILGGDANWLERKILGNVKYLWDVHSIHPSARVPEKYLAGTVPWMMWMNGRNHTQYAGAWSLLNFHDVAVVSGFAAAYRLGAKYPFIDDPKCKGLFSFYLGMCHGVRMRKEDRRGFFS